MSEQTVKETIISCIQNILEESGKTLESVDESQSIMDEMGLSSLQVAILLSALEMKLGVDPFASGEVSVTDVRTLKQLADVYEKELGK